MKDFPDRMTAEEARRFGEDVMNIVAQIPRGRVTTYGHIALLAGWPWICSGICGNRRKLMVKGQKAEVRGQK